MQRRDSELGENSKEQRYRDAILKRLWAYVVAWQYPEYQAGFYDEHQKLIDEVLMLAECLPNPASNPADHVVGYVRALLVGITSLALKGLDEATLVGIVEESAKEVER